MTFYYVIGMQFESFVLSEIKETLDQVAGKDKGIPAGIRKLIDFNVSHFVPCKDTGAPHAECIATALKSEKADRLGDLKKPKPVERHNVEKMDAEPREAVKSVPDLRLVAFLVGAVLVAVASYLLPQYFEFLPRYLQWQ